MRDAGLKDLLYKHFRAQGWYALVEVPVFHRAGLQATRSLVTDIDVLGLRATPDLRWELVIGDCKTRKSESPPNRALWVKSLMAQFHAARGILFLRREKYAIDADHRLFANSLGVTLIEEQEYTLYDRAVIYPSGSGAFPESVLELKAIQEELPARFPALAQFCKYIGGDAWNEPDHCVMIRRMLSAGRGISKEIDPRHTAHLSLVLEGAGVLAVALATCVGTIFHHHLQPNEKATLDHALKVLIWGGWEQFSYVSELRRQLQEARHVPTGEDGLALPDWKEFIHLVRSCLDAPGLAFQLPQLLRAASLDLISGRRFLDRYASRDTMLLKLGMLVASYFAQACRYPPETKARIKEIFLNRISNLTMAVPAETPMRISIAERPVEYSAEPSVAASTASKAAPEEAVAERQQEPKDSSKQVPLPLDVKS